MRILHVIPSTSKVHGGPSHALVAMERALSARGISVTTATTDDDGDGRRLTLEDQPQQINGAIRYYAPKWTDFYKTSPPLAKWLLQNVASFDVVHIHALFSFASTAAAIAAYRRGVPYIVRPLGTLSDYGFSYRRPWLKQVSFRYIEQQILRRAAAVHFTSQTEWDEANRLGLTLPGVVIPLGLANPEQPFDALMPTEAEHQDQIVLFLSRIDPKKNIESLIRAFGQIAADHPHARLVIAGDGDDNYLRTLKALADVQGVGARISWVGHIDGDLKSKALREADIFVLPSFSENFGIAAVEAMAAGCACVISNGVAIANEIEAAGAGFVTDQKAVSIAAAIDRLLRNDLLRERMARRAQSFARTQFSADTMAARLELLYAELVRKRHPRRP